MLPNNLRIACPCNVICEGETFTITGVVSPLTLNLISCVANLTVLGRVRTSTIIKVYGFVLVVMCSNSFQSDEAKPVLRVEQGMVLNSSLGVYVTNVCLDGNKSF